MRLQRWVAPVAVLGLLATRAPILPAQQHGVVAHDTSLRSRVEAQGQRIAELEALLTQREQPFQVQPAAWEYDTMDRRLEALETAVEKGGGKGGKTEWVDAHDQNWVTTGGGRAFFDYVNYANQNGDSDTVFGDIQDYAEFRSLRLFVEGVGYGVYDYRFELDFAPELGSFDDPAIYVKDMYVGIRDIPLLGRVAIGNQKVPFGLEALTRGEFITFLERAKPAERDVPYTTFGGLGPTDGDVALRRVGIAAYNHSDCPRWAFQGGIYFEDVDPLMKERVSDRQGAEVALRGVWLPMYANDGRQLIHVGAGLDYVDDADDVIHFGYRPEVHEGPITTDSGVFVGPDDYFSVNLEGAVVMGPASVQTELFATRVQDAGLDLYGAYVFASFFLTGENRGYDPSVGVFDRVHPLENFWVVNTPEGICSGKGAWELGLRWSYLDVSDAAGAGGVPVPGPFDLAGTQNNLTFGVNWYWNPYARMMFNYIHSWDSYGVGLATKPELDIFALRWQVDF